MNRRPADESGDRCLRRAFARHLVFTVGVYTLALGLSAPGEFDVFSIVSAIAFLIGAGVFVGYLASGGRFRIEEVFPDAFGIPIPFRSRPLDIPVAIEAAIGILLWIAGGVAMAVN